MKYRSLIPLNSARDAGVRITRFKMSPEAQQLLDELGVPDGLNLWEFGAFIHDKFSRMNPEQRRKFLQRMAELKLGAQQ